MNADEVRAEEVRVHIESTAAWCARAHLHKLDVWAGCPRLVAPHVALHTLGACLVAAGRHDVGKASIEPPARGKSSWESALITTFGELQVQQAPPRQQRAAFVVDLDEWRT